MSGKLQHTSEKDLRLIDNDVEWAEARKRQTDLIRDTSWVSEGTAPKVYPHYYNFAGCVEKKHCSNLMQRFYHLGTHDTGKVGNGQIEQDIRQVDLYYHEDREIINLLQDAFDDVNKERFFQFDIQAIEPPHMCVYHATNSGHYTWHIDWRNDKDLRRVISMSMLLNDGSEFEGGELEIFCGLDPNGKPILAETHLQSAGDVCFFKSDMPHRVKPVTKGTRVALVAWAWADWGNKRFSK